ncbi:receptor-mediated endocytosis protein 6 homolog isoform X2 [Condylostylus longicornis]|nr:receptor-mediated endocytosis protein 6 homolog isoform X2 [Condylostylus longicornis]
MQPDNEGNLLEIIDLAHTLRQEQLFIRHEQESFNNLRKTFANNSAKIAQLAWVCAQHKQNLSTLVVTRKDIDPSVCCNRANRLEHTRFVEAHKSQSLKYEHVISYGKLFDFLYKSPYLLAQSLAAGDRISKISNEQKNSVVHTIATGLYGNVIHSKDIEMILKLLRELMEIQIVISDNPRKTLRTGCSAFARLYNRLLESLFSAKIFLTAALYEPIMKVLIESEIALDIDPLKALSSYSYKEKLKRFGEESDSNYNANIEKYRNETIHNLYVLANFFLNSLIKNWPLFPSTLRWLIQTMCHQLKQAHINDKNINEILTDMVFTHFICPAIVSPETNGISDAPISEQARFNLIQIGQIIQMLALMKYEDVDPKFSDVYQKFDVNIVSNLLEQLLITDNGEVNSVVAIRSQQSDFERAHVLMTHKELVCLVEFFKIVMNDEMSISEEDKSKLNKILHDLPDKFESSMNGDNIGSNYTSVSPHHESGSRAKQSLLNLGKSTKNKIAKTISLNINGNAYNDNDVDNCSSNTNSNADGMLNSNGTITNGNSIFNEDNELVLVFEISISDENKFQLLTEEDFLKMNSIGQEIDDPALIEENIEKLDKIDGYSDLVVSGIRPTQTKNTRFSLSHDDASIGNSDNLEAVSEAPSNHSVTSSLELEENDQNDNLSDMVSANVSGRGTPNISGRDTPSSQVTDGDNTAQIPNPQMAKIINKARSEIEDKFCKFEIKKLIEGDETVSIISDTWSTDVLASDSETLDANERDRNFSTPLIPSSVVLPGDNNFDVLSSSRPRGGSAAYIEISETRSESAWSTDVLISDSEKLNEVDTDDNLSITAKSDITDAGGRSEGEPSRSDLENLGNANNSGNEIDREGEPIIKPNRTPDSPYFAPRTSSNFHHTPDSPIYVVRENVEPPFFPSTNSYEDPNREASRFASPVSSLARSSARTSNQYSNENNFQQNYKSSGVDKSNFLPVASNVSKMRRQNSAESSISNQSSNLDDNFEKPYSSDVKIRNHHRKEKKEAVRNSSKDLIDFSDYTEQDGAYGVTVDCDSNSNSNNRNKSQDPFNFYDKFSEEHVIHRRTSSENRNASFDGRRNGMMEFRAGDSSNKSKSRRHQSLNYENHEIIIKKTTTPQKVVDLQEPLNGELNISLTDDIKSQNALVDEMLIIQKTEALTLDQGNIEDNNQSHNGVCIDIIEPLENDAGHNTNGISGSGLKPSKSTGAIPKSISFDASADKSSRNSNARRMNDPLRTSFFTKIKQGFKNRRQHKSRNHDEMISNVRNVSFGVIYDGNSDELKIRNGIDCSFSITGGDMTEDILAKYRRKVSTSSETTNSDSTGNSCSVNRKNSDIESRPINGILNDKMIAFLHAKRKIRTVLAKTDLHTGDFRHTTHSNSSPLLVYLQIQLAQALNLQDFTQISYVSEAIRTLSSLDMSQHVKLTEELQGDILKRQSYLQYLMRYRQNLLSTIENLNQFRNRLRNDQQMCNRHLISVCVRMFLEKREPSIGKFQTEFCKLTVVDEKIDLLQEFIDNLIKELKLDGLLFNMVEWQLNEAKISIERILLQRLYKHVMFPNEDGDISRDKVFQEHIRKIQKIITPHHKALRISDEYLSEAPWPFAQKQIVYISAYKTPAEKFECIKRCITSIMNLLLMACDRIPAADDIVPVLIYVIIMANPPYLLSTIQYIDCFIRNELEGEDEYQWTQFCSAVELIKTLDYSD